jgi:predicted enzyme related to lactoylglutathione lyase
VGEWLGVLIAIASSALGGTAAAVTRYLVTDADPLTLAILRNRGEATPSGINHFGFQVDDIAETQERIESAGGKFFFDLGHDQEKENFERKFKDPDGIIFDISKKGWLGATG